MCHTEEKVAKGEVSDIIYTQKELYRQDSGHHFRNRAMSSTSYGSTVLGEEVGTFNSFSLNVHCAGYLIKVCRTECFNYTDTKGLLLALVS